MSTETLVTTGRMDEAESGSAVRLHPVVRRYLKVMEAGCRRNWRPHEGSDSHYLNWLIWESLSKEHKITAEEADSTWWAFLERHGDTYPNGSWREKEIEYMKSLASNAKLCRPADSEAGAQGKESNEN